MRLQVAMKVIMDNFSVLEIEHCLLNELLNTLSSNTMMKLDDTLTRNIVAKIKDLQIKRARTIKKLESLEASL
jgi:hypothetical protein